MSLKLDAVEESIRLLCSKIQSCSKTLQFHYPSDVLRCMSDVDALRKKLSSDLYGPRTKEKISAIVNRWNTQVKALYELPPPGLDLVELTVWTLRKSGFAVDDIDGREGSYAVGMNGDIHKLRIVSIKSTGIVFYLDNYECKLTASELKESYWNIPLRFQLACIYPVIYNLRPLTSLVDVPSEPIAEIARFSDLESLSNLIRTCKSIRGICDNESVWKYVFDNVGMYINGNLTAQNDSFLPSKKRIQLHVETLHKRRVMRFTSGVEVSDWASPSEYYSPRLGRRRLQPLDDIIL